MDDGLKQRLVGAFVLLALGVLFIPVLFDPDGRQGVDTTSQIPVAPQPAPALLVPIPDPARPQDIEPAKTPERMYAGEEPAAVILPSTNSEIDSNTNTASSAATDIASDAVAAQANPAASTSVASVSAPAPAASSAATNSATVSASPAAPEGLAPNGIPLAWTVQVSSHQLADKASALRDQLIAQGYKAYTRTVNTANGQVTRVYIGPNIEKAAAESVKAAVDKSLKVNSIVLHFEP